MPAVGVEPARYLRAPSYLRRNVLSRYTPYVASHMSEQALVLHSPLDVRDGGAEETAYGIQCLDYFLRAPAGNILEPDIIMFNWGLHDGPLGNSTVPGQAGLPDVYAEQLDNITQKLKVCFDFVA
mgnify:CR=1 FL=1